MSNLRLGQGLFRLPPLAIELGLGTPMALELLADGRAMTPQLIDHTLQSPLVVRPHPLPHRRRCLVGGRFESREPLLVLGALLEQAFDVVSVSEPMSRCSSQPLKVALIRSTEI